MSKVSSNCDPSSPKREKCLPSPTLNSGCCRGVLVSLCLVYSHSLCCPPSQPVFRCLWSRCRAGCTETRPSCLVLPPPCFRPRFSSSHHTKVWRKEGEKGGAVWKRREKCGDLGSQSRRPPPAYWDYIVLLKLCCWTCGRCTKGVRCVELSNSTSLCVGSCEQSACLIRTITVSHCKQGNTCSLLSWFRCIYNRLPKLNPAASPPTHERQ